MKLLSIKNEYQNNKKHKVINILGLKLKLRLFSKYEKALNKRYSPDI